MPNPSLRNPQIPSEACFVEALMIPDGPAESLSASPPYLHEQQPSPERLVEKCKAGCTKSFELLVQQYEKRIYNFLWQLSGNSHDAEDLTQETFLKAFQNIHRVNTAQAFSTWLFTIAKRTAFNHFRGGKRFQELSADEEIDFEDPSLLLEQKDEARSLWKLAKALKPDQYETLWLRYGEGFSIAETARILNTNQVRVRVLLHRARKSLAKSLGGGRTSVSPK